MLKKFTVFCIFILFSFSQAACIPLNGSGYDSVNYMAGKTPPEPKKTGPVTHKLDKGLKSTVRIIVKPDTKSLIESYEIASGFAMDWGQILTCYHALSRVSQEKGVVTVNIQGKDHRAKIIKKNKDLDYALLQIDERVGLGYLKTSTIYNVGDTVYCAGFPFANIYSQQYGKNIPVSLTSGIISGLKRKIKYGKRNFDNMIQVDAYCQKGNSGGPVFNKRMEVIGMVNFTCSYADNRGSEVWNGATFATPIDLILRDIKALKK